MNSFFKEVLDYHHHYNRRLLDELKENVEKLPQRTFPLYCHILNAHQIWNSRILNTTSLGVWDLPAIESCGEIDNRNYEETEKILIEKDLKQPIAYKNSKGQQFTNTIQDILFYAFNSRYYGRST